LKKQSNKKTEAPKKAANIQNIKNKENVIVKKVNPTNIT